MQITEIRWKLDRPAEKGPGSRLPLGGGITVLDAGNGEADAIDLVQLEARWIDEGVAPDETFWEILFEDDGHQIALSTDWSAPGRETLFRRAAVGRESEILGEQLEAILLPAAGRSSKDELELLSDLLRRMTETQQEWFDPEENRGKIAVMEAELADRERELDKLEEDIHDPGLLQRELTEGEEGLARLKSMENQLAKEQRQLKYLRTKYEYEKFLSLRQSLKDTEERAGAFGARITDPGHNITVHELTELAGLRNEVKELDGEARKRSQELASVRKERMEAEQARILAGHEARELENRERNQAEEAYLARASQYVSPHVKDRGQDPKESFPSTRQLAWLLVAFLAASAFLAGLFLPLAGYIVGGITLAAALFLLLPLLSRTLAGHRNDEDMAEPVLVDEWGEEVRQRLAALRPELDRLAVQVRDLEELENRLAAEETIALRRLKRKENELLLFIRPYAGPSQITEVDDILAALSQQRDTDSLYQETVADLLRQIAEIKYGRSDEEMLREYDDACSRLYGEEGEEEMSAYSTRQLFYDPDRSQAVSQERLDLGAEIDVLTKQIRAGREKQARSREASVASGSLKQRRAALLASLKEARTDYNKRACVIGWLSELLLLWPQLDRSLWRETAGRFLTRMTGRRPTVVLPDSGASFRAPRLEGAAPEGELESSFDPAVFLSSPQPLRYLAWRLAFASLDPLSDLPLFLFDPYLPPGRAHRTHVLDALEEWILESGSQLIYLTEDPDLLEEAKARQMKVYNLV